MPVDKMRPRGNVLHVGSKGAPVKNLEARLKAMGLYKGKVDAKFDQKTKEAVQKYERKNNRLTDGKVGSWIYNKLVLGDRFEAGGKPGIGGGAGPKPDGGGKGGGDVGKADDNVDSGKTGTFTTVTANIRSSTLMPQSKVVHDVKKVARQGDLIGWQEIGPARYRDAVRSLGKDWGHYMPRDGKLPIPNPISWKKDKWELMDSGFKKTHGGKAKVSPNRYITWVKLRDKKTGESIVRVNTHLVSGAWTKSKLDRPTTPWRQDMWKNHMADLDALVSRFEKKGEKVIIGGDFNRDSYRLLGNDVEYANNIHVGTHNGRATYDYLMNTRHKELKKLSAKVMPVRAFHTDHDPVVVKYKLG